MGKGKRRAALVLLLAALLVLLVLGALRWRQSFRAAPADGVPGPTPGVPAR